MTILGNIHQGDRGRHVRALGTARLAWTPGGPGFGEAPDDEVFARRRPIVAGELGVVTDVESHGSNPWTRYCIRFASDGAHQSGLVYGDDFTFADGRPQTDTTRRTI